MDPHLHPAGSSSPGHGFWQVPDGIEPGIRCVRGVVHCIGGIARVDVLVNGEAVGPARVDPAGSEGTARTATSMDAFEVLIDVPDDLATLELGARATGMDGRTFDIAAASVRVGQRHLDAYPSGDRVARLQARATLRARALRHVSSLAGSEPIRALVFAHDIGEGTPQLALRDLLLGLESVDAWCTVVTPRDGLLREELEAAGIPVHVAGPHPVADIDAYEGRIAELLSWAAPLNCNVAVVNTIHAFPGADVARRLELPLTWLLHENQSLDTVWGDASPVGRVHRYVQERAVESLRSAEQVVFPNDETRATFSSHVDGAAAVVQHPWIAAGAGTVAATADPVPDRGDLEIDGDRRVVLCVGDATSAVRVAQAVRDLQTDVVLVVAGAEDGSLDDLRSYIDAFDLGDLVRIEATGSPAREWYGVADLVVCAADVEAVPRYVLEAMSLDVPVLATAVTGVSDLIIDGETGFLVEPRDGGALRDRIDGALSLEPELLARIGAAGGEHLRAMHDFQATVEHFRHRLLALARAHDSAS